MLSRLLQAAPYNGASRRAYYSVFSSKPGGGRYFNSAKPHKVSAPAAPTSNANTKKSQGDEASSPAGPSSSSTAPPSSPSSPSNAILTPPDEAPTKTSLSQNDVSSSSTQQSSPQLEFEEDIPRLPPHPSFSAQTYPLHQFFALHRPLLHLPLPTASLFVPAEQLSILPISTAPQQVQSELEGVGTKQGQDETDTARQIARAMAIHKVGPMMEWAETLASLGDRESMDILRAHADVEMRMREMMKEAEVDSEVQRVQLDSTKRKRRRKMSKHKLKKRRKATRAQRRKLGK